MEATSTAKSCVYAVHKMEKLNLLHFRSAKVRKDLLMDCKEIEIVG